MLADPDIVNVIYLLTDEPNKYHKFCVARNDSGIDRKMFWQNSLRRFKQSAKQGVIGLMAAN